MEYKLPILPDAKYMLGVPTRSFGAAYDSDDMRQYAEQAVAPLLAEIERLKRGEFICKECGLRKNSTTTECGF